MKDKGYKFCLFFGWTLTILSIVMLWQQGMTRSYFHQDDVVELGVVADWRGWTTIGHLNNEHLNITFWPLLHAQWQLFGINFVPYLTLNILFHIAVLGLVFAITHKITKSFLWSSMPVWGMVINANWFTVVWWITGQMFFLATISALLTYWVILKTQENASKRVYYPLLYLFAILPGLSWGMGLSWPVWPLLIFGIDYSKRKINLIGGTLILSQITLMGIYFSLVGSNLGVHTNPRVWLSNPLAILNFTIVGISNTLVGRWLWPPEEFRTRVIFLFIALIIFLAVKPFKKLANKHILLGILMTVGCFVTVAIPRWPFGIGQAMANYYAYFPLPFLLISVAVFLSKMNLVGLKKMIVVSVFLLHIPLSWIGFEDWAGTWVIRPQQTRAYFQELNKIVPGQCIKNRYIPEYIVPQNIWHIDYLWPIFKKDFSPFCLKENK